MKQKNKISSIETHLAKEAAELKVKRVLMALSGGADSVATAFALKRAGIDIKALHCNFHLRGEESQRDANFVKNFCERESIRLEIKDFDVCQYKILHKGESTEMACRNLRYKWFFEELELSGFDRIATGHNADDNIETFFLNLLRGSGSRGLKGMEKDSGKVWRPLLSFHRPEIIDYLADYRQTYIIDSTNLESDYRRNFLRNEIIPLLKKEWKGFDTAMDKSINFLNQENRIIEQAVKMALPLSHQPFDTEEIISSPSPLLLIRRYIDPLGPYVASAEEILKAIRAQKPSIRKWQLKKGTVFLRNRRLFIESDPGFLNT